MSPSYTDFLKKTQLKQSGIPVAKEPNPFPQLLNYPVDVELSQLIINNALISDDLANAITDGEILETSDYAAGTVELTVEDSSRELVHGLLAEWVSANDPVLFASIAGQRRHKVIPHEWNEILLTVDGRDYALVGVVKNGSEFQLTFESRSIHELRKYSRPRVWYRDTYTRAQVFKSMCDEVQHYHVEFYAPELNEIQPIRTTKGLPKPKEVQSRKMKGFAKGTKFTVKGHPNSSQQKAHAETILRVGESMHAPYGVLLAALIAAIEMSNLSPKSLEAQGGSGLFGFVNSTSEAGDTHAFFSNANKQYARVPGTTSDILAYLVVAGTRPLEPFTPSQFARWIPEGEQILKEWGTSLTGGSVSFTEYNRYAFKRGQDGKRENSWNCMVRLAKEVNFRVFSTDNIVWYVSDNDLRYAIPFDTVSEATDGINSIDYEIDTGKPLNSVTIQADLARWQAPPGVPIVIEDSGPANGRWLVFEVRRPLIENQAEITCHLPSTPLPEPAPTTKRVSISGRKLGQPIALTGNSKVDAVYAKAVEISNKHYPYVFGGGHTSDFSPSGGGYDCSGYVSACLNAGGMLDSPQSSDGLRTWGQPGQGKMMTVWTNPNPGATGHVFIELKLPPPAGHCQANTSHSSGSLGKGVRPGQGAALVPWGGNGQTDAQGSPGNNFFPRHWPGT